MKKITSGLYEIYNQRRDELLVVAQDQSEVVTLLQMDAIQTEGTKQGEIVNGLITRLKADKLRVLIVGRFSAGKSTFINALLGEKLLPATPTPTTGVLCNIMYADEAGKKVTLYPKEGMGHNGDKPFDIPVDELEHHIKIDHFNGSEVTSKYRKMDLAWPLKLCANGVELIDSVGLDDPDSRDDITLDYAKSVDAVLYLMKSQDTGSKKDLDTINLLRNLGYESLFFIITYYDHIKESAELGEQSEEDFQNFVYQTLLPFTELGKAGVKFVDSKAALLGRIRNDRSRITDSGIENVEQSLESFLVEEKGRAKLLTTLRSLKSVNKAVRQVIPSRIDMLQTSTDELERRYEEAKIPLSILETKRQLIVGKVESTINDIVSDAYDMADSYFLELPNTIPTWAKGYKIESGLGLPPRKSTLEPVVREVLEHLKFKIESDVSVWTTDELSPMILNRIQEMQDSLEDDAKDFLQSANQVRVSISVGEQLNDEELASQQGPSVWGRILSGGYMLMTGDFVTGGMGMVMGLQAMLKTILIQIVAGIILAIFGLLNPVAIIAAAIASIVAGGFANVLSLKGGIKNNVSKKLSEEVASRRKDLATNVKLKVKEKLVELRDALDAGLAGELSSIKSEVENILQERRQGKIDAQKEICKLRTLEKTNLEIDTKLDALMCEAGLLS